MLRWLRACVSLAIWISIAFAFVSTYWAITTSSQWARVVFVICAMWDVANTRYGLIVRRRIDDLIAVEAWEAYP